LHRLQFGRFYLGINMTEPSPEPLSTPHNKVKSLDELCSFLSSKRWMDKVGGRVPETPKN